MIAGCILLALGLTSCIAPPPEDAAPADDSSVEPVAYEVRKIEYGEMYQADFDGDGQVENFIVQIPRACPDEGTPEAVKITVGNENEGVTSVLSEGFLTGPIYQIQTQNGLRLLLGVELGADEGTIALYKFEQWRPVKLDGIPGYLHEWENGVIRVQDDVDVLGTWDAKRDYVYWEDWLIPAKGALWEIEDTDKILTVAQPLKVQLQQADGSMKGTILEAGIELKMRATDRQSMAQLQLRDGRIAVIIIDGFRDGQVVIDGKRDDYYFNSLPYSG